MFDYCCRMGVVSCSDNVFERIDDDYGVSVIVLEIVLPSEGQIPGPG